MDDLTDMMAPHVESEDQGVSVDAPWGINPKTGAPYKRDPEVMARVREARFNKPAGTAPRAPKERAASSATARPKPAAPKYGRTVAKWVMRGADALLADPVERAIIRGQAVELALVVDRVLEEDPRLAAWLGRLKVRWAGGAKAELAAWAGVTGGMIAVHRGYRHPVLVAMLGGAVEAATLDAFRHEQEQASRREEMTAFLAEQEREAAAAAAAAAAEPAPNGAAFGSPLSQFVSTPA